MTRPKFPPLTSRLCILIIILLSVCIYINTLKGEFIWHDKFFIAEKGAILQSWKNLPTVFSSGFCNFKNTDISQGIYYRPLVTLSYSLDYLLWKLRPAGYHLTNIFWHTLNGIMIFIILLLLTKKRALALLASMLFISHPIQTACVSYITNRVDILCLFFMLFSWYAFIKSNETDRNIFTALSLFSFVAALLAKEAAIVLPLLFLLHIVCFKKIKKQKVIFYTTAMIFTSCAYLLIRYNATRSLGVQSPLHENKVALALTMLNVITDNIRLLLWPSNLSTSDAFLISRSIMENYTFVSFMIISALIAIAIYYLKKDKLISFCLFWFFITLLPVLNIIPILYLRADHFLYIPSLGFCILTAAILHKNRAFLRHSLIIILIFSILTISRNKDWQNEISLFSKSIKSHPQAKEAHACLGFAYHQKGLHEKASHHYKKALISNPSYYSFSRPGRILENLANIYYAGHLYKWAEKYYQMALEFEPEDGNIHLGLGNVYYEQNQYQKAIDSYQASLRYSPSNSSAHHNLSKAYEKQVGLKK